MKTANCIVPALLLLVYLSFAVESNAQGFEWPEKAENLTVLPEDTSPERLRAIMGAFTDALGVRCSHCHVGEGPLSEYDFVSDDIPAKEKTRIMMQMTGAINQEYISALTDTEDPPQDRLSVNCTTCHRNVAKPFLLEDLLTQSHAEGGVEEVLTHYDELRQAYYGGFSYDFRAGTLTRLAERLHAEGDTAGAIKVLEREISLHDNHADGYILLGDLQAANGNQDSARAHYEKAFELVPPRMQRRIQEKIDALTP